MAGLSITGQMKVSTLQEGFLKEFGLMLRVYDGRSLADPTQRLAQVRKKKGSGKDLSVAKNMKVGNLEDKFEEEFGLKVQVAGSDDSYLCDDNLTLNAAQQEDEKKASRKERKAERQEAAGDDGDDDTTDMPKESQNMLHLGFHINVANININNTEELSESGKNILKLAKKGDDITFKECVSLLEKNLSVLYLSFNVYELEDVFDSSFEDEIDALEFKVVKVYKSKGDYINFDLEGSFKIAVTQEIKTEERLREIEEEFDGHFDNGVTVQVDIFNENDGDELVNDGMGDGIDGHEGLSIWVIE